MKKLLLIGLLITMPAFAAKQLTRFQLVCDVDPAAATVNECRASYILGTSDDSRLSLLANRVIPLTAGQETTLNSFLSGKVSALKTAEGIE